MKKFSLVTALVLGGLVAFSLLASAQQSKGGRKGSREGGAGGRPTVEQQLERLSTELNLTDEQKPKVKAVLEETSKKVRELFQSGDRAQAREKMQAIRDDETKKMKEILKPDQFEKWQKLMEERRSRFSSKKKGQ